MKSYWTEEQLATLKLWSGLSWEQRWHIIDTYVASSSTVKGCVVSLPDLLRQYLNIVTIGDDFGDDNIINETTITQIAKIFEN